MYAVIEDGSRQYRVSEGDLVTLDYRQEEPGAQLELTKVLLYVNDGDTQIGTPVLDGLKVVAEVVDHPTKKHYIQKFRRRKNSRRLRGHRQKYTRVKIANILLPGQEPSKKEEKPAPQEEQPPQEQPQQEQPQQEQPASEGGEE